MTEPSGLFLPRRVIRVNRASREKRVKPVPKGPRENRVKLELRAHRVKQAKMQYQLSGEENLLMPQKLMM